MAVESNPYVGPRPFENKPEDIARFFGRSREARDIVSLIIAQRTLVLYGRSGTGKSSLLNAAVLPELLKRQIDVFMDPARVQGVVAPDQSLENIDNIYVYNALSSWTSDARKSLKEFVAQREHRRDVEGEPAIRVMIFDQFEELFTSYPTRWPDREVFFDQVDDALTEDALLRVVFVMREDYIAELDSYRDLVDGRLRTRFRLERLRPDQARLAVINPLEPTRRSFAPEAAVYLVDELRAIHDKAGGADDKEQYVEPVVLQVVCQNMWDALDRGEDQPNGTPITVIGLDEVREHARVTDALRYFYDQCIETAINTIPAVNRDDSPDIHRMKREANSTTRGTLRDWFGENLITEAGTRRPVVQSETETEGMSNIIVGQLENLHIIRGEERGKVHLFEIVHDRFVEPILESNEAWKLEQERVRAEEERLRRVEVQQEAGEARRVERRAAAGRVFVEYSRRDHEFVRRLAVGLQQAGIDVWVDWEDIPYSADWWEEIKRGIEASDNYLVVLSNAVLESIVSNVAIEYARSLNKRIIPVTISRLEPAQAFANLAAHQVDDVRQSMSGGRDVLTMARDNWFELQQINWLIFDDQSRFDEQLLRLVDALSTDLEHVRTHTRLLTRASEWERAGRDSSYLLRGADLSIAERWLASGGQASPQPTHLHEEYIDASSRAAKATARRQLRIRSIVFGLLVAFVGLIAVAAVLVVSNNQRADDARATSMAQGTALGEATQIIQLATMTGAYAQAATIVVGTQTAENLDIAYVGVVGTQVIAQRTIAAQIATQALSTQTAVMATRTAEESTRVFDAATLGIEPIFLLATQIVSGATVTEAAARTNTAVAFDNQATVAAERDIQATAAIQMQAATLLAGTQTVREVLAAAQGVTLDPVAIQTIQHAAEATIIVQIPTIMHATQVAAGRTATQNVDSDPLFLTATDIVARATVAAMIATDDALDPQGKTGTYVARATADAAQVMTATARASQTPSPTHTPVSSDLTATHIVAQATDMAAMTMTAAYLLFPLDLTATHIVAQATVQAVQAVTATQIAQDNLITATAVRRDNDYLHGLLFDQNEQFAAALTALRAVLADNPNDLAAQALLSLILSDSAYLDTLDDPAAALNEALLVTILGRDASCAGDDAAQCYDFLIAQAGTLIELGGNEDAARSALDEALELALDDNSSISPAGAFYLRSRLSAEPDAHLFCLTVITADLNSSRQRRWSEYAQQQWLDSGARLEDSAVDPEVPPEMLDGCAVQQAIIDALHRVG